ncbi:lanthionine synthetase LanC family protein [Streptomyces sp. NPDC003077]|uniref:class III lanthionine synthetase LanKC N-terminal domain-containing protein n=1 Tax=Streptomyces sp. NPDC003077 TaxID=3154443 RepID=UPI0033BCD911
MRSATEAGTSESAATTGPNPSGTAPETNVSGTATGPRPSAAGTGPEASAARPEQGRSPARSPGEQRADLALLPDIVRAAIARAETGRPTHTAEPDPSSVLPQDALTPDPSSGHPSPARPASGGWTVEPGEFWCHVRPPGGVVRRAQGWKLHVSATPLSAPLTLARAAEVLVAHRAAFKFAGTPGRVAELVSGRYARGGGGKFLTVYPADDAAFRLLAEELHRATRGLPGPAVLSDRRYLPDSQVFYRFGAFAAVPELTNDGCFAARLTDPDGRSVPDERKAWFSPPAWAGDPFPGRTAAPVRSGGASKPVLLNGRYRVRGAIQHSNKGGVFRAEDTATGEQVVVKQARAHVGAGLEGLDVQDLLRREASLLGRFGREPSAAPLVPRLIETFDQQGSVFLVTESVPGATVRRTVADRLAGDGVACPDDETAHRLTRGLVGLVTAAHDLGLTLHDFNPNNVMVTPDGRVLLIDLEMAAPEGERWVLGATPGYAAPELLATAQVAPALPRTADLYALGATVLPALTGADPLFAADRPVARPTEQRLGELVRLLARDHPVMDRFAELVLGLMRDEPGERWDLERVERWLGRSTRTEGRRDVAAAPASGVVVGREVPRTEIPSSGAPGQEPPLSDDARDGRRTTAPQIPPSPGPRVSVTGASTATRHRLLRDGVAHLLATMRPRAERLWPSDDFGETCDPVAVQHGAAGPVAVLARALGVLDADHSGTARPDDRRDRHDHGNGARREASAAHNERNAPHHEDDDHPDGHGYDHGDNNHKGDNAYVHGNDDQEDGNAYDHEDRPRPLWSPEEAQILRDGLRTAAEWTVARQEAVPSHLPGLHFGRSGTAWALLDAARALDDAGLAQRAKDLAVQLPLRWPNPDVCHGAAGAGLTQLHFWHATGDPRFLDRAAEAADGLLATAQRVPEGVFWPVPEDFDSSLAGAWHYGFAHGVAGVSTFLLAAAEATGDERCLAAAVDAGHTLATAARKGPAGALWPVDRARHLSDDENLARHWCSGSSGVGTFLVRLWHATGATDSGLLRLVEGAARAVVAGRAADSTATCHGLTGNAEFLLDAADLTGDPRYRAWADLLVDHLAVQAVLRDGRLLLPDENRATVLAEYATGLAGTLSLLLRLRHGGGRPWLPVAAAGSRALPGPGSRAPARHRPAVLARPAGNP